MLGTEFDLILAEGGTWLVDGDGPAGFALPSDRKYWGLEDLSPPVDLALRRLGLELVALTCDTRMPVHAHVAFRRPE